MRTLFVLVFLIIVQSSFGQEFPSQLWHEGKLVTVDSDTISGELKYDLDNDLVQISVNKVIKTYSSRKIFYFEIFDEFYENYRYFYSLPYRTTANYETPILFEVLYEGPLTLLCREYITQETVPQYSYYRRGNTYRSSYKLDFNYYFVSKGGSINQYFLKKKELLDVMQRKSGEVKQFMKNNNLKYDKRGDLVRITAYYNSLIDS
ncbi:hypothetical protein QQ008_15820 [Fulvivirgaceae bacterium BMA10]|uniref:Uncharacterized protein n=1 Tax=Splendidivirga corallicola TaxID=3051826 RepID=A0ABT8KR03_9BACT|nr:hypothetical protein [Fulvivirgaceae bacterium BMA10]